MGRQQAPDYPPRRRGQVGVGATISKKTASRALCVLALLCGGLVAGASGLRSGVVRVRPLAGRDLGDGHPGAGRGGSRSRRDLGDGHRGAGLPVRDRGAENRARLSRGPIAPAPPFLRDVFRRSQYAAVLLDPRLYRIEVLAYGRIGEHSWGSQYRRVEELPSEWSVALNGTFFSLTFHEPAGVLIYGQRARQWTPSFVRLYDHQKRSVVSLPRWYLAVYSNGQARIGDSKGRSAKTLATALQPPPLSCLLGGGGLLVQDGKRAISSRTLEHEGFDERSGVGPERAVPRTGVGLDGRGRLWFVTAGLGGGGLSLFDFADLFVQLGARQALFLDCGSSTAMRVGSWQRSGGRAVPTWLVARPR